MPICIITVLNEARQMWLLPPSVSMIGMSSSRPICSYSAVAWRVTERRDHICKDEFFDRLMHNLLDYEIDQNGIKQAVLNLQNRQRKEMNQQQNANLIVSTIHGAKGLEFDNVVVLHAYDTQLPEDRKRMSYVAFTRAMKSELVLSFGKQKGPRIKTDYELIVNALHKREQFDALRASGVDIDAMTEEELEQTLASMVADRVASDDREPAVVP